MWASMGYGPELGSSLFKPVTSSYLGDLVFGLNSFSKYEHTEVASFNIGRTCTCSDQNFNQSSCKFIEQFGC